MKLNLLKPDKLLNPERENNLKPGRMSNPGHRECINFDSVLNASPFIVYKFNGFNNIILERNERPNRGTKEEIPNGLLNQLDYSDVGCRSQFSRKLF